MEERNKALDIIEKSVVSSSNELMKKIYEKFGEGNEFSYNIGGYQSLFNFMLRHIIGNMKEEYDSREWDDVLNQIVIRSQSLFNNTK